MPAKALRKKGFHIPATGKRRHLKTLRVPLDDGERAGSN
jgi:hypothetical protein